MDLLIFFISTIFISYILYIIYKHEKSREVELNYHLMQAKRILSSKDIQDKRKWFIEQYNEAESHLASAQASCSNEREFRIITDIREKLNTFRNNNYTNN
jgi:hypothetical protein